MWLVRTALASAIVIAAVAVASPAHARFICGDDASDPCASVSAWTPSYSQADVWRLQFEASAQQQQMQVTSSIIQQSSTTYRAVVTSVR
jgi:hypothetical protein